MHLVSRISPQKRRPNRFNVFLDRRFAFGCSANVIAKFKLREGAILSAQQVAEIQAGEVQQGCFDDAMKFLQRRLHSRAELRRKLMRREHAEATVSAVLDKLEQLGYVDDATFARTKALSAAEHKQHGRRRALAELMKSGVKSSVAQRAVEDVYDVTDTLALARQLAAKHAPRLRRLDAIVARRRLAGMLQRRGFTYDDIRPVIDEVLGYSDEWSTRQTQD